MKSSTAAQFILLIALLFSASVHADEILLLDAETGFAVNGELSWAAVDGETLPLDAEIDAALLGRGQVAEVAALGDLPLTGTTAIRIVADGYQPLRVIWRSGREAVTRTVLLEPLQSRPLPPSDQTDQLFLSGWVSDSQSRRPVEGAIVSVSHAAEQARSNAQGYYELRVPAPLTVGGRPEAIDVRVEAPGFPELQVADRLLAAGSARLNLALGADSIAPAGHRQLQTLIPGPESVGESRQSPLGTLGVGDAPPGSITVGFADASCTQRCCSGSCTNACTMSLEEYVRRGLPKEWIASWNFDALAAGAVAYRSYGAWHVFNPPQSSFDVCSSACCQVNEPGTQTNTNVAAAATAGVMLKRDGQIFRSEYSAQNNNLLGALSCVNQDLSCGNSFAGSPNTGWPCLADPVSADQACFGHGRGMSQWGNQYWTQANPPQAWKWQLNHYYNDSGSGTNLRTATISQVLVIDALRVTPAVVATGKVITLEMDVRNLAASTHEHVMIGASLRQPPGPFIDDPANDQPVSLPPGSSTVSRQFVLPDALADGSYAVYASLFLDVDRNQSISGTDLAQQLVIQPDGLTINADIFADRFED